MPDLYDAIRPRYPMPILQSIESYAQLTPESHIVEIGPGTGQASEYFINKGYRLTGIDLGPDLVAYCRNKFARHANADFVHASFEKWQPLRTYDLMLAAQSFHWIEPQFGLQKAASLLVPNGTLALVWHLDESDETEFWRRGFDLHRRYFPDIPGNQGAELRNHFNTYRSALHNSKHFTAIGESELRWNAEYSADDWIKMRRTFSPDLQLAESDREQFYAALRALIDSLGGIFVRHYRTVCVMGHAVEN